MNRRPTRPTCSRAIVLAAALAGAAAVAAATPVQAGIGNPLKKAKEQAEKAVAPPQKEDQAKAGEPLVFDDLMLELTEARVAKIAAVFQEASAITAGRPALVEKRNKVSEERAKLDEKYGEGIRETQRKRDEIESCYHDGYHEAQERKTAEYQQKALTDPTIREKFAKVAAENNEAAARGDSAAQARINAVLMAEMLPSKEDSAKARQACGPLPPKSAAEQRMEDLDKEIASLDQQIRDIDDRAAKAQAKDAGLTPQQWGTALERIQMFLVQSKGDKGPSGGSKSGSKSGSGSGSGSGSDSNSGSKTSDGAGSGSKAASKSYAGFTDEELDALFKHRKVLSDYLGFD